MCIFRNSIIAQHILICKKGPDWKNDQTLVMTYKSSRELMLLFMGLVKGVGKHFNENLGLSRQGNNLEIKFPQ